MIPKNPVDVAESLIRNTLIPFCLELPNDIVDSHDNENEEDDEDDLSPMPVERKEADCTCLF